MKVYRKVKSFGEQALRELEKGREKSKWLGHYITDLSG